MKSTEYMLVRKLSGFMGGGVVRGIEKVTFQDGIIIKCEGIDTVEYFKKLGDAWYELMRVAGRKPVLDLTDFTPTA